MKPILSSHKHVTLIHGMHWAQAGNQRPEKDEAGTWGNGTCSHFNINRIRCSWAVHEPWGVRGDPSMPGALRGTCPVCVGIGAAGMHNLMSFRVGRRSFSVPEGRNVTEQP